MPEIMETKGNADKKSLTPSYFGTEGRESTRHGNSILHRIKIFIFLLGSLFIFKMPKKRGIRIIKGTVTIVNTKG